MSAAIAMAPSPAPHERQSLASDVSPASAPSTAPPSGAQSTSAAHRLSSASSQPASAASRRPNESKSPKGTAVAVKSSPPSISRADISRPRIVVKKEPGSPTLSSTRPRPRKLDLSKNTNAGSNTPATAVPISARDNLGIQEVGIACLSPGFVTQDPVLKEQLQRSMSVREQQRHIIEARLQQQSAKGDGTSEKDKDSVSSSQFAAKTPGMSRRNKAPPGLSIVAPSHEQFATERVIQSAPLGHSFTGRQHPAPLSRHVANQPSNLSSTSHIHHVPANQTNNRLPPLSDVFGQGVSLHSDNGASSLYPKNPRAPLASPSAHLSQQQLPASGRSREYKSAEDAQQELSGGRPELLPKLVHYGGHQPPTPPSPALGNRHNDGSRSASKRRTRAEYEDGGSPPLGHGPAPTRRGPFGEGRDSPETQRQKKDEFLRLCSRAWDLFHS
ncbi:hypothetical protein CDD81_6173 [Ophiocordyceps australis]|uniref:Uncharacterized protein n=1 Tax=Ophiocordyceps australis TaxID=1399860 RepID=A0A2C5Y8L1_9HYPO|nr:hypothetical protein CDD81_6173 [Ophiocordyceps australis]